MNTNQQQPPESTNSDVGGLSQTMFLASAFGTQGFLIATLILFFQQWIRSALHYIIALLLFSVTLHAKDDVNKKFMEILEKEKTNLITSHFSINSIHKLYPDRPLPAEGIHILFVSADTFKSKEAAVSGFWRNVWQCKYVTIVHASLGGHNERDIKITLYTFRWNRSQIEADFKVICANITKIKMHTVSSTSISASPIYTSSRFSSSLFITLEKDEHQKCRSTLLTSTDIISEILKDVSKFFESEALYRANNVPYRRGYLFHGKPGTGKSSLAHVLASELQKDLYSVNLSAARGINSYCYDNLAITLNAIPRGSIVVFEDIDVAFPDRNNIVIEPRDQDKRNVGAQVTMSEFLNAIDGSYAPEGSIFLFTTNHLEKLDPAMIRGGRVDVCLRFGNSNKLAIRGLCNKFLGEKTPEDVDRIVDAIPENTAAPCDIQGFLMNEGHQDVETIIKLAETNFLF